LRKFFDSGIRERFVKQLVMFASLLLYAGVPGPKTVIVGRPDVIKDVRGVSLKRTLQCIRPFGQ